MKNPKFTLKPVADKLGEILQKPVTFLNDCVGSEVEAACANPEKGSVILLENMRFYAEEEGKGCKYEEGSSGAYVIVMICFCFDGKRLMCHYLACDMKLPCCLCSPKHGSCMLSMLAITKLRFPPNVNVEHKIYLYKLYLRKCEKFKPSADDVAKFRESLAKLGDIYVCDAFGTAHRAHSSMVGLQGKMPCVSGLLVAKELEAFSKVLDPSLKKTPLTSIVGGAKISDKVLVIGNLIDQSDNIIICGGMAYTFLKTCFNMPIGKSLFDKKGAELAPKLLEKAKAKGCKIILPCDWACGQDFCNEQDIKMVTQEEGIPDGWEGMDCGPKSSELFRETVLNSATVIWNGPAGVFEFDNFSKGTKALLEAVAETTAKGNTGIIGGGDSATAAAKWNMEDKVTFVSTGGGASLELLEGKNLPGVAALDDK